MRHSTIFEVLSILEPGTLLNGQQFIGPVESWVTQLKYQEDGNSEWYSPQTYPFGFMLRANKVVGLYSTDGRGHVSSIRETTIFEIVGR